MNLRAPWLRGRYALLSQAALDACCIGGAYGVTNIYRNGAPGSIIGWGLLTVAWISFSYLIGRYRWEEQEPEAIIVEIWKVAAVSALVAMTVSVSQWGADARLASTRGRGVTLFTVAIASMGSIVTNRAINKMICRKSEWTIICAGEEKEIIAKEVAIGVPRCNRVVILDVKSEKARCYKIAENVALSEQIDIEGSIAKKLIEAKSKGWIVTSVVSWCERYLQRVPPELLNDGWIAKAEGFSLRNGSTSWRVKRLGDVAVSGVLIFFTLPLILLAAFAILLEDGRPLFYKQVRNGLRGKRITIWKLRSMRRDAESEGAQWSRVGDKRVTKVGRVIRTTRIDELPQLISVLNGDLSLIGPRPERPEMDEVLSTVIPNYGMRVWVRPGLSGWAQVCYPYGSSVEDSRNKLSYDIYYLRNYSIALDFMIAIKTIRLVSSFSEIKR